MTLPVWPRKPEEYVCQQCRLHRYPDCCYDFHPTPPEGVPDRYRVAAEEAGR